LSSANWRWDGLRQHKTVLTALSALPRADVATDIELLHFMERHVPYGRGVGYVDIHLLASARLSGASLWTYDKRLRDIAGELRMAAMPPTR
jgi:predicted nucleic acid-binding protein